MEQKLRMSPLKVVFLSILFFLIPVLMLFLPYAYYEMSLPYNLFDIESIIVIIMCVLGVLLAFYGFRFIYNSTAKALTFNNVNFTYKDKTYTYQQIEKIKIRWERFGISYEICIGGEDLYSFDEDYYGAEEFLYYLNFYNVPGTPRS